MASLILKTRLDILSSNLAAVETVIELVQKRRRDGDALRALLFGKEGVGDLARRLRNRVDKTLTDLRDQEEQSAIQALGEAQGFVQQLTAKLEQAHASIDALLGSPVELSKRRIKERLPDRATLSIEEVNKARDWHKEKELAGKIEPLFSEYVDLLRGLALRETGIERGICELADRLLDGCDRVAGTPWESVAIPSYRGSTELMPAQIVRLAFPEWTIWALPLAAYEFGRIMVNQDAALQRNVDDAIASSLAPRPVLIDCLADAFATYALGPAYACAAVMMRLDPRPVNPGEPALDDPRARMIFEMLREADARAGPGISFDRILAPLERAWSDALTETGAADTATSMKDFAARFWPWAKQSYVTANYPAQSWLLAEALRDVLEKLINRTPLNSEDAETLTIGSADLRDMLNGAWLLRLDAPEHADAIATEVTRIWRETTAESPKQEKREKPTSQQDVVLNKQRRSP